MVTLVSDLGYGYGEWYLAILYAILFSLFLVFVPFRKKMQRLPSSVYLAFVVALYAEMYGFPLTIYALSWLVGYQNPLTHLSGHILASIVGENLFFAVFHPLSDLMIAGGAFLVMLGWSTVHNAKGELVSTGLYAYIRHPQYLGFLVITLGMIVQWTTIPTLIMWPLLALLYYRLARQEEREMQEKFGDVYAKYREKVPMLVPLPFLRPRR